MRFLSEKNLLHPNQHGFRPRLGCETQLVELLADLSRELDLGNEVDACLLDFSKAFDTVNHQKLLQKMMNIGLSQQVISWTSAFLKGRSQRVALEGSLSSPCEVTSGVPQGSVVGPVLFLIYINDLPLSTKSNVRLFADDTIVYVNTNKQHQLQDDLRNLEEWENRWDMRFNPSKCEVIRFCRKRKPVPLHPYTLHNTIIPRTDRIKYLGVNIQNNLRWDSHITAITNKAATRAVG